MRSVWTKDLTVIGDFASARLPDAAVRRPCRYRQALATATAPKTPPRCARSRGDGGGEAHEEGAPARRQAQLVAGRANRARGRLGLTALVLHNVKQPHTAGVCPRVGCAASSEFAATITRGQNPTRARTVLRRHSRRFCLPYNFILSCRSHSLLSFSSPLPHFAPPLRSVRSAGGAWMPATHPDRHAMTGMQTPHRSAARANPPCVRCAPQDAPGRDRSAQSGRSPACVEASCGPSDGIARLAALHVGFLARARACRCPACPPRSCGNLICRTGHRYPEERVSRASPARSLAASGTPRPRPPFKDRL